MQSIFSSILEYIKMVFGYSWVLAIIIPALLFVFAINKIGQWRKNGIIKSRGIFNLAIALLAVVMVVGLSIMQIFPYMNSWLHFVAFLVFIAVLFFGWFIFRFVKSKNLHGKKDAIGGHLQNAYEATINEFTLFFIISGPIIAYFFLMIPFEKNNSAIAYLFPIIILGIAIIITKFFNLFKLFK